MKYFNNITTAEELKKQFRSYCVTMHPDKGGDPEEFKIMLSEYEEVAKKCGVWNKIIREEAQGVRRGLRVIFFGPGMNETRYIITDVQGENIKIVRIFSHDFRSLEDIDSYLGDEWSNDRSRRELNKYDHIRPLSQKFGIGYYWDDVEQKTYTEQEIGEAERIADNFDRWAANWKANKEEEERRAQEESDREEAAIIAQWSSILEQLPEEYKRPDGLSWSDMTNEQREAEDVAERKSNAERLAAFKRNLKAIFNHFWPGVKCSFKTPRSIYKNATISWTDGPTVADVEACEVFNYFLAYYYKSDPYADCGDLEHRTDLNHFRQMFGAFDCDSIDYNRKLSDKTADKVRQVIAENFPEAEKSRQESGEKYNTCYCTFDMSNDDISALCALLGFVHPAVPDWKTASDEEKQAYCEACKPFDDFARRVRNSNILLADGTVRLYYCTIWKWFVEFYHIESEPQKEKTARKEKAEPKATEQPTNDTTNDEKPADGLELVEIPGGVAVVGGYYDTLRNRKQIKAHGAKWNKEAKQWQATDPEAVERLRQWFVASATQTAEEAGTINENDREKALFVIFAACEIGRLEWHTSGYTYTDATAEDWEDLEAVAPEVVTAWREAGNPINRNECARLYGEELTKEAEEAHTVARHRAKYCEVWRDELREIWAIYKDLAAIESATTDTDAHAEEQEQEQHAHNTTSEHPEPQEHPEQKNAEDVERVTRFATLLAYVFTMFEELATAAQTEAQRAKESSNKQAEAEQLRADIAKMSAQVAKMAETLRAMSERLATLETEANADSHTDNGASDTGTASDNEPQRAEERPDGSKNKPETLNMLKAAARHAEQLTEINEHTEALLARLYVLAAIGLRVRPLIERVKAIEAAHVRGYLTIEEASERYEISREAERKSALYLTPEEFRALYRHDPQTDGKAA